jgi:hypothetical protein
MMPLHNAIGRSELASDFPRVASGHRATFVSALDARIVKDFAGIGVVGFTVRGHSVATAFGGECR